MERVLVFITQLQNRTPDWVEFRVPYQLHPIHKLPAYKTGIIKQYRILRYCRENGRDWSVGVLIDGNYMGLELSSSHLLNYARIVFRCEQNKRGEKVLVVDGIQEDSSSDYFLRLRYFGWMRNIFWDKRPSVEIARSDSREAIKLRGIEARQDTRPHLSPRKLPTYTASPAREVNNPQNVMDKSRAKFEKNSNTYGELNHVKNAVIPPQPYNNMDGFVYLDSPYTCIDGFVNGILFMLAFMFVVFMWIR